MMIRGGWIYILTNQNKTTLYVGVTANLRSRIYQHKTKRYKGFTSRYNLHCLVYYEPFPSIEEAINREKQVKAGSRKKKITLIEQINPGWNDLWDHVTQWDE